MQNAGIFAPDEQKVLVEVKEYNVIKIFFMYDVRGYSKQGLVKKIISMYKNKKKKPTIFS